MKPVIETSPQQSEEFKINKVALFSWIAVFIVIAMFWAGITIAYKDDYVPRTVAKIHHTEKRFLANHKSIQRKLAIIRKNIIV